jgi:Icc-related predicted phosphoesterase
MKILVMSDLHLEHGPRWSLPDALPEHDVVVLAGDIHGTPEDAVEWAEHSFMKPVVYVPGNHEYYGGAISKRTEAGILHAIDSDVHIFDRDSVVIDGVKFVGCTLWTDFELFGMRHIELCMARSAASINDFRLIRDFSPSDARKRDVLDRGFIKSELSRPMAGRTVVVTHHAPHPFSIEDKYKSDMTSAAFASDLTGLIEQYQPSLWIHGHMHASSDYRVGDTRIVCNPKGYGPHAFGATHENGGFEMKIVEV